MYIQITILFTLIIILGSIIIEFVFRQGTYYKMTGNGYFQTISDIGRYGEYLTYKRLRRFENDGGKFLFNCYLPKADGTTTEIDVILIHSTGIFVIESKNYSGWIFGSENGKTWTQTLPNGKGKSRKERFYNPIMQNKTHIKWLREIVGNTVPIYSIIAFSERCTLKDVTVESTDVKVINRQNISSTIKCIGNYTVQAINQTDIERIYGILYPYTQVTAYEKIQHINNVNAIKYESTNKNGAERGGYDSRKTMSGDCMEKERISDEIITESAPDIVSETEIGMDVLKEEAEINVSRQSNRRICPRCKAELVIRTAKKGEYAGKQFYGCSQFPKCRYTEHI